MSNIRYMSPSSSGRLLLAGVLVFLLLPGCSRSGFVDENILPDGDFEMETTPPVCSSEPMVLSKAGLHEIAMPEACSRIRLALWGAGGGSGGVSDSNIGGEGGGGAFVNSTYDAVPGTEFVVFVGGAGQQGVDTPLSMCGGGGGGGGGASFVLVDEALIAVAGGGGGGGGAGGGPGLSGEPGLTPSGEDPVLTRGGEGENGFQPLGQYDCSMGFGGSGGFSREASGGTGGCRAGAGGSGGGGPGGIVSTGRLCKETANPLGGHGGSSHAINPMMIEPGSGRNPGNVAESFGAGLGGNTDPGPSPGTAGRAVLLFK